MTSTRLWTAMAVVLGSAVAIASHAVAPNERAARAAQDRLTQAASGPIEVRMRPDGAAASFVRARGSGDLMPGNASDKSREFLREHGATFGLDDADAQLRELDANTDSLGQKTATYQQVHNGVPVFGARIKTGIQRDGRLTSVNGALLQSPRVDTRPALFGARAREIAVQHLRSQAPGRDLGYLSSSDATLYVYNAGFVRQRAGIDRLVYEVEVTGSDLREFVYVDAHSGKIADQITGTYHAIDRRIYEGGFGGGFLVWQEGDAAPTGNTAWDNLIEYSEDTYNLVSSMTNGAYLSWDGNDGTMHAVNNDPAINCPNAQFTGSYIRFCNGTTTDDIVTHEWFHGYTQETHGVIYLNQSGAINEAYSDIFGEVVDFLNGDGTDSPNSPRTDGECSLFGGSASPSLTVNAPVGVDGTYFVAGAGFNPPSAPVSAPAANAVPDQACGPIGNLAGQIALINRGNCPFTDKVLNAQAAGAVGVIIVNNDGDGVFNMGGSAGGITIPSVMIGETDGTNLRNTAGVNATIVLPGASDNSYRWLTGEDASAFGGAIRDMWNPGCFGDPGRVSDPRYACDPQGLDNGGVHSNSGIINHGFALLVDGGTYNGQTIAPIGLTKAAHLYWRTMSVYQTPISGYSDHAAALQASCADLIGTNLRTLSTNQALTGLSGDIIDATDCAQVDKVVLALELNQQPVQCGFQTLLAQDPPPLCGDGEVAVDAFAEDFDTGLGAFTAGSRAIVNPATHDVPDWTTEGSLPFGRPGMAAFGADPVIGNCSSDIEAGVTFIESPAITLPADGRLSFTHSVSTEADYDGGNVKVSVNGGPFQVVDPLAFIYNAYNGSLTFSDNPLSGEDAFHGTDGGTFLSQWGESQINLLAVASPGDQVRVRFELGVDGCNGVVGWYVDDVRVYSCEAGAPDSDGDGVSDDLDNCQLIANADQRDTNGDGYGNVCDTDLDNNGITNVVDLGMLRAAFFGPGPDADFNGDGIVNVLDLGILKAFFFAAPGPSGVAP